MKFTKTLKVRLKDKHIEQLNKKAQSVNYCWNYINGLSQRFITEKRKVLSAFDLHPYMVGAHKELGLHSQTLQCVAKEYVTRRKQFKKSRLAWRKSKGSRRSLGWIPINTGASRWKNGQVYQNGNYFDVRDSYGLSEYTFRTASFNEDARGRWYFNVVVEFESEKNTTTSDIGIDLGLKTIATASDGSKIDSGRWHRDLEPDLKKWQRARRKKIVRTKHAKISNRRKDALHKFSRSMVNSNAAIFVGDVSSLKLAKTKMAKSVLDAGWGSLKTMLKYKCDHAGIVFEVVNEKYTTRTCSSCGCLSGPKGVNGLAVRRWDCVECGVSHNRDQNAAINILASGRQSLAAVGHGRP